jgi:hypothetical protein
MIPALVRKELRETRAIVALALVVYLIYLMDLTGNGGPFTSLLDLAPWTDRPPTDLPFVEGSFESMLFLTGVVLAIALGFRQSAWEPSQGTALYLLHLPLSRRAMMMTKVMTGLGLLLGCTLLPILLYAVWASRPGTHAGPFEWSMTASTFRNWLILPLFYLGAFASGIRPARWLGSRLLPLLAVILPAIILYAVPSWWLIGLPLLALIVAVLVSNILWEAETRDF